MRLVGPPIAAALALISTPAAAQRLDDHTVLIPGGVVPGRQPDGNTVLIEGQGGLIVFDTGRHAFHSDKILAAAAGRPIVAIINSHWHLDHVSGNLRLKQLFPGAIAYGTGAIDGALSGFLKNGAEQGRQALAGGKLPAGIAEDVRGDLATIEAGARLRPDVILAQTWPMQIAGMKFVVGVSPHAATEADLWLYDPAARRVIVGDLVTLPAPFLDTACPEGWDKALDRIDAIDFDTLIPGHGPAMSKADFRVWKLGFETFLDCTGSERPMGTCASGWLATARHWLSEEEAAGFAGMVNYYGELLRSGKLNKNCPA